MPDSLDLSIDTFTVSLREFIINGYERIPQPTGEQEYSLNGTPIADGILYEPKYLWTIGAFLSEVEWQQLWLIYRRSERKRSAQQNFAITLADYIEPFVEDSATRSRALAPGGVVEELDGGGLSYPTIFSVRLFEPRWERCDNLLTPRLGRCVLRELSTVPA